MMPNIPDSEFESRLRETSRRVAAAGLDVLVVHSNEADFANVRYLSDFWPLFESAGVAVFPDGRAVLLIGPESETFARHRSKLADIRKLVEYREPAEPDYPGIDVSTFDSLMKEFGRGVEPTKIGLAGWAVFPLPVYASLKSQFPSAELVKADDILFAQRSVKSSKEMACLKAAFAITRKATDEVIQHIRPGVTELQLAGVAQRVIYESGAEYEGLPQYVLSGECSSHAIGRAGYRVIVPGDIVQLNLSARVHGYSPSIGVPVVVGEASAAQKELLEFGLEAHQFTHGLMKAGTKAGLVAQAFNEFIADRGYSEYQLYGPCHGLGMIEVERPWVETTSDYELAPGMTFQVDTYFYTPIGSRLHKENGSAFGLRWENGVRISESGEAEWLSPCHRQLVEVLL